MPTLSVDINVEQVVCQKAGCSSGDSPASLVVTSAYLDADGYMIANGTRLPENWCRINQIDANGTEVLLKVYCPTCAAGL